MHGARMLARDYIHPLITSPETRVLDVCCGDKWVQREMPTCQYFGMDKTLGHDLVELDSEFCDGWQEDGQSPDLILSIYGLQHLLNEEARVWTLLRRIAKPTTKFVYVGRWSEHSGRETSRQDPLNSYSSEGLRGLASASGWKIVEFKTFLYSEHRYFELLPFGDTEWPNAFAATLVPLE